MQSFALLSLIAAAGAVAKPIDSIPANSNIVTGTAYTATFEEADAVNLEPSPGYVNTNRTYQGLNWTDTNLSIQKPAGTATTFYLIPESSPQYGQILPVFTDYANLTRSYGPPNGVIRSAVKNEKIQLNGFYFGCSRPGPTPGYSNAPVNCTVTITGTGGIGGESQETYVSYAPVIGNCRQLGSTQLSGQGCARLTYVAPGALMSYSPYDQISFSISPYLDPLANQTSIFIDEVSYVTTKVAA